MKLRALRMANVRCFGSEGVAFEGIGDGLNVYAAPNEAGKSTLFDGLQALLFFKSSSTAKEIRQLRPYAGGSPHISADVEYEGGRYRIEKRFLGKRFDRVVDLDTNQEIAVADEAQAWIDRMIGAEGNDRGPAGLLWVRQGESSSLTEGSEVRAEALASVVEQEVTTLTGGKRARRVLERCSTGLGALVTATGRPKSGGGYERAIKEVKHLDEQQEKAQEKMDRARDALEERSRKKRRHQVLRNPDEEERQEGRLSDAREAKEAAEEHQERVATATMQHKLARREKQMARSERDAFAEQCQAARDREVERDELQKRLPQQRKASKAASAKRDRLAGQAQQAEEAREAAKNLLDTARKAQDVQDARERHAERASHLAEAEAAEKEAGEKRAAAQALGVRQDDIDELNELDLAIDRAENALRATTTRLQMRYKPGYGKRIAMGKVPLEDEAEVWIEEATILSIDDVGDLAIAPGEAERGVAAQRRLRRAREALADKLRELNCEDVGQARQRRDERARLNEEAERAESLVAIRAPQGITALRAEVALLEEKRGAAAGEDVPDVSSAEHAVEAAETAEWDARNQWDAARQAAEAAALDLQQLTTGIEASEQSYERALERVGIPADEWPARQEQLDAGFRAKDEAADRCEQALQELRDQSIDLPAAEAALQRLTQARKNRQEELRELEDGLTRLDERIKLAADEGVEEAFSELTGKRELACAQVARYEAEIAALQRLKRAVEEESAKLKERYLQPVNQELRPLLGLLFEDASVEFDGDTLEPKKLTRSGVAESVDALSGGTREQVAILTRLGFARLLAKAGRTPPIIMDDALIFSDDDRIEKMFTALHMQASDLQMLVFSCRQRAFQDLGGTVLQPKPWKNEDGPTNEA